MTDKYFPPLFGLDEFNCPICGVYAEQHWGEPRKQSADSPGWVPLENTAVAHCHRCKGFSIWINKIMIYPLTSSAPMPSDDMLDDIKGDYEEARNIVAFSPRSACALLRLSIQKLMIHLGETGKDLNEDIGRLVKKGLPIKIQKALDSVRVIGNNSVHPGEMDLKDDNDTALALFRLVNMIIDVMITQPKSVDNIFDILPKGAKEAISKRDKE